MRGARWKDDRTHGHRACQRAAPSLVKSGYQVQPILPKFLLEL